MRGALAGEKSNPGGETARSILQKTPHAQAPNAIVEYKPYANFEP